MRETWLWVILILSAVVSTGGIVAGAIMEQESPMNAALALAIVLPIQAVLIGGLYISKLEVKVNEDGIRYRFYPVQIKFKHITAPEIMHFYVRDAPVFKRGISFVFGYGWAYTTAGGKGVQFHLKNGKKIFLGSQRVSALRSAIENLVQPKH